MSRIGCLWAPFYHEWVCRNSEKAEAAKYINQEIRGMICIRLLFGSCIYRLYHTHALGTSVWEVKLNFMIFVNIGRIESRQKPTCCTEVHTAMEKKL